MTNSSAAIKQKMKLMRSRCTIHAFATLLYLISMACWCHGVLALDPDLKNKDQQNVLRIINSKTCLTLGFRNPQELIEKSRRFREQHNFQTPLLISGFVNELFRSPGFERGIDKNKPIAVTLHTSPTILSSTIAFSTNDLKALAESFGMKVAELRTDKITQVNDVRFLGINMNSIRVKGDRVFLGTESSLLDTPEIEHSLEKVIPPNDAKVLANDDFVLALGQSAFEGPLRTLLSYLFDSNNSLPAKQKKEINQFLDELKYVIMGIRLDDGIASTTIARLKNPNPTLLSGDSFTISGDATLARLPAGKILVTHALQADSDSTGGIMGSLLSLARTALSNQIANVTRKDESFQMDGLLSTALSRVKGGHLVLYENEDRSRNGDFSLLGILTTDDPHTFVSDLTGLAPFMNAASMNDADATKKFPPAKIAALVKDLGNAHYQLRELAKLKLSLLGPHARAALKKAARSDDLETRLAAQQLLKNIEYEAATDRSDLIKGNLFKKLKPVFSYSSRSEIWSTTEINILTMRFQGNAKNIQNRMLSLFGPDWQKMKIAITENKVLFFLGTEISILKHAIARQKQPRATLEGHKACRSFRARAMDETVFEFHAAVSRLASLLKQGVLEDDPATSKAVDRVSSIGVTFNENEVRIDTYTPPQDIKTTLETGGSFLLLP